MSFSGVQFLGFIHRHCQDASLRSEAAQAILTSMFRLAGNDFKLEPLQLPDDLELVRHALSVWLGRAIQEVRPVGFEQLIARQMGDDEETHELRVRYRVETLLGEHRSLEDIFTELHASYLATRVSSELEAELEEAGQAAFAECALPRRGSLLGDLKQDFLQAVAGFHALALFAAALNDAPLYQRVAPLLPWLTHCVPIGELKAEPGVWTVLTSSAPQ